jgi:translation initiation factor IF-3
MSARITIHEVKLKPETDIEEFETYVKEVASTFAWEEGASHRFIKYKTGKKSAEYFVLFETTEETYNLVQALTEEERQKRGDENFKMNPQNKKIVDKMKEFAIDWMEEGHFAVYTQLD